MKVVVVGAGYAGTFAANRVAKKVRGAEVTVVNARPEFVERIRLHQRIAGTAAAATPLTSMLRAGVASRIGTVEKIGDGTVLLDDGESLGFDHLFLAVGSTVRPLAGTVPVGTWEGAERARTALAALPAGSTVTVVGGGPTGIETAAEVADARPGVRVRLIGSSVAACLSGGARQRALAALSRLGVEVVDDGVEEAADGVLRLRSGREVPSALTLWAIVEGVPELAARSGLDVDAEGRVVVDAYLRSVTDQRIFAVGDCAGVAGSRFGCQTAAPQARAAADALARLAEGREPEPYALRYVARCVSLGRKDAVAQFTHPDDSLKESYLKGGTAVAFKRIVYTGTKYGSRKAIGA
ncbi:NAD(P)/FAD-dependent oxidoreductase [Streptomyces echinatus]|uniref:NADH dehydrogenase FAD-containing subunit n=1 Tax=Streptomyces echinatus TaxID=67293 RepID=A0A7W9PP68_9ACTN|nr:FAD-dependent oxidoreductase [Streptomyces echinatus]MBB5925271.1 NADH dehydrogenase FAD-containing subunit [Streptomyces echinatus]